MTEMEHVWVVEQIDNGTGGLGPEATLADHIKANSKGREAEYRRLYTRHCPVCGKHGRKGDAVVTYYADRDGSEYRLIPPRRIQARPETVKIPAIANDLPHAPSPRFTECSRCRTTFLVLTVSESVHSGRWKNTYLQAVVRSTFGTHPETEMPLVTHEVVKTPPVAVLIDAAEERKRA